MRAGVLLLLGGCLSAPADADDPGVQDGGAAGGDAVAIHCVSGSTLDLAYVSRIAVMRVVVNQLAFDGMAVFINPGEDTIVVPQVTATAVGGDPAVTAAAGVTGGEAGMVLAPREAKGALVEAASGIVRPTFAEAWNDTVSPSLQESFSLLVAPSDAAPPEVEVPIQVQAGDYAFAISVTLVDDSSKQFGTPLAAARGSATCD